MDYSIMIINSPKSIIKYESDTVLDLINPPKGSKTKSEYHNFINNILCIYDTEKYDGTIPVFWTKHKNDQERIADTNSTLKELKPDNSYYIIALNNNNFPITIPSVNFVSSLSNIAPNPIKNYCSESISIDYLGTDIHNIILDSNIYKIHAQLNRLIPNKNYYYELTPIYSNWPAYIYPQSGFINNNTTDNTNNTSGIINSIFRYYSSGEPYTPTIPYSSIDYSVKHFDENIFSLIKLSIYNDNNNLLLEDTINIRCNKCLNGPLETPTVSLGHTSENTNNTVVISSLSTPLELNYEKLDPKIEYGIEFFTINGNWPSKISPHTSDINPETLYTDEDNQYYKGSIICNFSFLYKYTFTQEDNINLQFFTEPYNQESFISKNLFQHLGVKLIDKTNNSIVNTDDIIIQSTSGLKPDYECINNLHLSINDTNYSYPTFLSSDNRPGSEITVDRFCCDKDQLLTVNVSGACCGEPYIYNFYSSNPLVSIQPSSGTVSFGNGEGNIAVLYNLNNRPGTSLMVSLYHPRTNYYLTDSVILRCPNIKPFTPS